jgi:hypothetical protein
LKSPADNQLALFEVDVVPRQTKGFTQPKTGSSEYDPQGVLPIELRGFKQPLDFADTESLDLLPDWSRPGDRVDWISRD